MALTEYCLGVRYMFKDIWHVLRYAQPSSSIGGQEWTALELAGIYAVVIVMTFSVGTTRIWIMRWRSASFTEMSASVQ